MSGTSAMRHAQAAAALALLALASSMGPSRARAFEPFEFSVPCAVTTANSVGQSRPCITCHNNPDGGSGCCELGDATCAARPCLNPFGVDFRSAGQAWTASLAALDSDGDGYTNGQELGDSDGTWTVGTAAPQSCACATRPGFDTFTPGDEDADGDRVCCVGQDLDANGDCRGASEAGTAFDCDDSDSQTHSLMAEDCAAPADNDCDGQPSLSDADCASVVDRDGDGYCLTGQDGNGNGSCLDPGEPSATVDCDDTLATVFPGANENCTDGVDNDCNGQADSADPACRNDVDLDMDAYCPRGRDQNGNGTCADPGEAEAGSDCDDQNPAVNSGAVELCTDGLDNDCSGQADFADPGCANLYDADHDGYCPSGRDGDGDRACLTSAELSEPGDCDDTDANVNPAATEVCVDAVDRDCDGLPNLTDPDCATHLDADGDRYCFVGVDVNRDGDCADAQEATGNGDCDDRNPNVNPTASEVCTDGLDNDCDGSLDAFAPTCADYRDADGDGYCIAGADGNGDGDCADAGEAGVAGEVVVAVGSGPPRSTDTDPTVHLNAGEDCNDRKDNDLDGQVDTEDADCREDVDADQDGWCPLGRDHNGDGDCLDLELDENTREGDCNDQDPTIHPGAEEACRSGMDRDCDSDWNTRDTDCFFLLDLDGDRFCGMGVDDNADGDCLDADEDRFGVDCDDQNAEIGPRAREVCDDGVDNDCDQRVDRDDPQCACTDSASCDDNDPCTVDTCQSSGACEHTPDATCGEGGAPPEPSGGCGCRLSRQPRVPRALFVLFGLFFILPRRRERA